MCCNPVYPENSVWFSRRYVLSDRFGLRMNWILDTCERCSIETPDEEILIDCGRHQHSLCQSRSCRFYGTGRYFLERQSQDDSREPLGHWGIENNNHVVATGGSTQNLKHKGKPIVHCEVRHTAHALPQSMRIASSGVSVS